MSEFTDVKMQAVELGEEIPIPNWLKARLKEFCSNDACPIDIKEETKNVQRT